MFLPEAVHAADALFNALRVPRQVIVDQHRAELQVDTFGGSLGCDHEPTAFPELIHEGFAPVGIRNAYDKITALVLLEPPLVDRVGFRAGVGAVEQDETLAPACLGQGSGEVVLGDGGVGEDDRLLRRTDLAEFREALLERINQLDSLLVDSNGAGKCRELTQLFDFVEHRRALLRINHLRVDQGVFCLLAQLARYVRIPDETTGIVAATSGTGFGFEAICGPLQGRCDGVGGGAKAFAHDERGEVALGFRESPQKRPL